MQNKITIAFIIGLLIIVTYFIYSRKDKCNWNETLKYDSTPNQPYDKDIFIDLIKGSLEEESNFEILTKAFPKYDLKSVNRCLYLFVGRRYAAKKELNEAVFEMVSKGGTAFISAKDFSNLFLDKFLISSSKDENQWSQPFFATHNLKDTQYLSIIDLDNGNVSSFPISFNKANFKRYTYFTDAFDDNLQEGYTAEQIGFYDTSKSNFVSIQIGKGKLYLHSMPAVFGNYNLKSENIYQYTNAIFNYFDYDFVYWDELKFNEGNMPIMHDNHANVFQELFNNRALKTTFYLLLFFILFSLSINSKRKVAPIPVINPVENTSIIFSKIISRLYWLSPNHQKIGEMKMRIFLAKVRKRYGISTLVIDDRFKKILTGKTGLDYRKIEKLIDTYKIIHKSESIHESLLIQLNELIFYVKKRWK